MASVFGIETRLFNKDNRFGELIKGISRLKETEDETKRYFIKYLNEVKQGTRNNDFYEDEFLERVIKEVINGYNVSGQYTPEQFFEKLILRSKLVFPFGTKTEDYDMLKDLFVNCISTNIDLFNDKLFVIFTNKRDYIDIINIIKSDQKLVKNIDKIYEFAIEVSTCSIHENDFKNEIVAFINSISRCDNIDEMARLRLAEAKKKIGVYNVDEKTLSLAVAQYEKARGIMQKADNISTIVDNLTERVKIMGDAGKKDIADALKDALNSIKQYNEEMKDVTTKLITDLYKDTEADMKAKADKAVEQVLENAASRIGEMKIVLNSISTNTYDELLKVRKAIDDGKNELKEYAQNEPKLRALLADIKGDTELSELLTVLKLNKTAILSGTPLNVGQQVEAAPGKEVVAEPVVTPVIQTPGIIIPGNDRLVLPVNSRIIIPDKINDEILPAFDERIPFSKRMAVIKDKMLKMEKEGITFHAMTEELVTCILEGDWPYVWGPSGCGKSYIIDQVAELIGINVIDNGKITDKYSVMAYNDPHGRFRATPAFIAVVYGGLLKLDEFDNGNSDTHVVLNELYSKLWEVIKNPEKKKYVTFAEDMTVPVNVNFRMVSAGNTPGDGADEDYSSRNKIDEAVQERYTPMRCDYDENLEQNIFGNYAAWFDLFIKFRRACDGYAKQHGKVYAQGIITTRDADAIAKYIRHNSKSLEQVLKEKFIQVKDSEYLKHIIDAIRKLYAEDKKPVNLEGFADVAKKDELAAYTSAELGKKLIYLAETARKGRR